MAVGQFEREHGKVERTNRQVILMAKPRRPQEVVEPTKPKPYAIFPAWDQRLVVGQSTSTGTATNMAISVIGSIIMALSCSHVCWT